MNFIWDQHQSQDRILLYFSKYKRLRMMNPNPNFPKLNQQTFWLFFFIIFAIIITNSQQTLFTFLFYLVNLILNNSNVPCGLISILREKLLFLTLYTCHKIVIKFLVPGKSLIFVYKFLNIVNIINVFIFLFKVYRVNLWGKV